jgi:hypothetical protein
VHGDLDEVTRELRLAEQLANDGEQYQAFTELWDARNAAGGDPALLAMISESASSMMLGGKFTKDGGGTAEEFDAVSDVSDLLKGVQEEIEDMRRNPLWRVTRRTVPPILAQIFFPLLGVAVVGASVLILILGAIDALVGRAGSLLGHKHTRWRLLRRLEGWVESIDI